MEQNKINNLYIFICGNTRVKRRACGNGGNDDVYEYFRRSINLRRNEITNYNKVKVNKSGCLGRCCDGPVLVLFPENTWYTYQNLEDIDSIINEHVIAGNKVSRLLIPEYN